MSAEPDRHIQVGVTTVTLRPQAVPPFQVEHFKSGASCVLDANGVNWLSFGNGRTLCSPALAIATAQRLNETMVN